MKTINALLMILFLSTVTYSAEFVWFKVNNFEGWAETGSENNTNKKKIFVMPRLYGPGIQEFGSNTPDTSKLLALKPDGSLVIRYEFRRDLNILPSDFKREVYKQIHQVENLTPEMSTKIASEYDVQFTTPKNLQVSLLAGGRVLQTKEINTSQVPNSIVGAVYSNEFDSISYDHNNYSDIRNGQFRMEVKYLFPYAQFSSIDLKLTQTAITKIQVETFKQVIQQSSTSGGSFFIFDFRKTYVRNIEKERISSTSSSASSNNLSITVRDPDENTMKILDKFMGAAELSIEKFKENHRYLAEKAFAQNNPKLGNLSERYVKAVEQNDSAGQLDVLKAAAALAKGDVLSFMAAGIRFSDSSISGNSTYIGSFNAVIDSTNTEALSAVIIRTVEYEFSQSLDKFPSFEFSISQAEKQLDYQIFQTEFPNQIQVDSKFLESVRNNNISIATLCLKKWANPNMYEPDSLTSVLLTATRNNNLKMAELLLRAGADPNLKNVDGENPLIVAQNDNLTSMSALLNQYKDRLGNISILIKKPADMAFDKISVSLNKRKSDFVFGSTADNNLRSNVLPLFAANYLTTITGRVSLDVPRVQLNPQTHYAFLRNGFAFTDSPSRPSVRYYKTITIYGYVKSVNGVTNEYTYEVVCGNFNCDQKVPTLSPQ